MSDDGVSYTASVKEIDSARTHTAPDTCRVWELEAINAGEICQFQLGPKRVGAATRHKTVSEIWFITSGRGRVWIDGIGVREIRPGTYFIVPPMTGFQVRNDAPEALTVLGLTMPKYQPSESIIADGPWRAPRG